MDFQLETPRDREASIWPLSIDWMDPRKISATYAPACTASASDPAQNELKTTIAVIPKYKNMSCTMRGVPLITVMYTWAIARSPRFLEIFMKATISPMPTAIMRDTAVSFRVTPVASRKGTKYSPRICHMSVKFEPPVKPLDTVYRRELRLLSAAPVRTHLTPLNLFPRPSDLLAQTAAAEPLGADLVIRAVGDHLFQRRVHSVHEPRVIQVDGNTHFIHIKRVSHRFYCKAIFIDGREAHYLVRNDGIHSARHQILEGNDIAVIPCDLVLIGQRYGDILECGSLHHPYLLAF